MKQLNYFHSITFFYLASIMLSPGANAACPGVLPADATAASSLYLCKSNQAGTTEHYACQDFTSASGNYRVKFKGGSRPRIVSKFDPQEGREQQIWPAGQKAVNTNCQLPLNQQVPATSRFHGAGICMDENDKSVPCAVFRHKSHRRETFTDYLTLYRTDGTGARKTEAVYSGYNKDAMPAELAYQIGVSLLNTGCCQTQGLEYIRQAYLLFPTSSLYSQAYQQFKSQLSTTGNTVVMENNF